MGKGDLMKAKYAGSLVLFLLGLALGQLIWEAIQ